VAPAALAGVLAYLAIRRFGWRAATPGGGLAAFLFADLLSDAPFEALRSVRWSHGYVGLPALVLAPVGLIATWRRRQSHLGDGFFVILTCTIVGLILYNPHSIPVMPRAARRFVPFVIPAVLIMAAAGIQQLRPYRAVLALAWMLLALGVIWPAYRGWRKTFYSNAYIAYRDFSNVLPVDGVFFLDSRLHATLLGIPLWLIDDKRSLPVRVDTFSGRGAFSTAVLGLMQARVDKLYWLRPADVALEAIPATVTEQIGVLPLRLQPPTQTLAGPPQRAFAYEQPVAVVRVTALVYAGQIEPPRP
jgi:hypothetical protein